MHLLKAEKAVALLKVMALLMASGLFLTNSALAEPGFGGDARKWQLSPEQRLQWVAKKIDRLAAKLELSEAQQAQWQDIIANARSGLQAQRQSLKSLRGNFRSLADAGAGTDELATAAAEIGAAKARLMVARVSLQRQLEAVLTDEQRQRKDELKQQWRQRMAASEV